MHKQLMLLGLLQRGPLHGYELHRIVRAHGELYAELKKANTYYLLERMAQDRWITVRTERGARGPRGERLVYALTNKGKRQFDDLLRRILVNFELTHTGLEMAVVFLNKISRTEAVALLKQRRHSIVRRRKQIAGQLNEMPRQNIGAILAVDHLLGSIDSELLWTDRALAKLRADKKYRTVERGNGL